MRNLKPFRIDMSVQCLMPRLCTTGRKRVRFTVGAVYDRAIFAIEWDKRAVIDRAYSKKWPPSTLCKALMPPVESRQ